MLGISEEPQIGEEEQFLELLEACELGNENVVTNILQRSPNIVDREHYESKQTPLHAAVINGHLDVVKSLLEAGAKANKSNKTGRIPLHYACFKGKTEIVKCLLEHLTVPDVNIVDEIAGTPLHYAVNRQYLEIIQVLLDFGAAPDKKNKDGQSAFHLACFRGKIKSVQCLMECSSTDVNGVNNSLWTPLHVASEAGHVEIVEMLLQGGAVATMKDNEGSTPLHRASMRGHTEIVSALLQSSSQLVNMKNEEQVTALLMAAEKGHWDVVEILMENEASLDHVNADGYTVLHYAAKTGITNVVQQMLQTQPEIVNLQTNTYGFTALQLAASEGHLDILEMIIAAGATIDVTDANGLNALHKAAENGHSNIVAKLLEVLPDSVDTKVSITEATPLILAAGQGSSETVQILISHGAKVDATDKDGFNALHKASENGHTEIVKKLVSLAPSLVNSTERILGNSALIMAAENARWETVQELIKGGADLYLESKDGVSFWRFLPTSDEDVHRMVEWFAHTIPETLANERDKLRNSALLEAVASDNIPLIMYLRKRGASPHVVNEKGVTPLDWAVYFQKTEIIDYLVNVRSDIDTQDGNRGARLNPSIHINSGEKRKNQLSPTGSSQVSIRVRPVQTHVRDASPSEFRDKKSQENELSDAVARGRTYKVKKLLQEGANREYVNGQGETLLHIASKMGYFQIVRMLVFKAHTEYINARNEDGNTPLHYAAQEGHIAICQSLMKHSAIATSQNKSGLTPLHLASFYGKIKVVEYLIHRLSDEWIAALDKNGSSALHLAEEQNHQLVVEILKNYRSLRSRRAKKTCEENDDEEKRLGLESLPYHKALEILVSLGESNEENSADASKDREKRLYQLVDEGNTALHLAILNDDVIIAKLLMTYQLGEPTSRNKQSQTPLHLASMKGGSKIIKTVVKRDKGSSLDKVDEDGNTPLHLAVLHGHLDCVQVLLSLQANPCMKNGRGQTPLHIASTKGQPEIMECLLKSQTIEIVKKVDNNLNTSLHLAVQGRHVGAVKMLLAHDARPWAKNEVKNTPLHIATVNGDTEIVHLLLENSSQRDNNRLISFINTQNKWNETALHRAAENGFADIAKILLKYGADVNGGTPTQRNIENVHQMGGKNHSQEEDRDIFDVSPHTTLRSVVAYTGISKLPSPNRHPILTFSENVWIDLLDDSDLEWWKGRYGHKEGWFPANTVVECRKMARTPLFLACERGHLDVVELLLTEKTDFSACKYEQPSKSVSGGCHHKHISVWKMPLEIAIDSGHKTCVLALIKSPWWKRALKNGDENGEPNSIVICKLIRYMPDVAKVVFDKCIIHPEKRRFELDCEFLLCEKCGSTDTVDGISKNDFERAVVSPQHGGGKLSITPGGAYQATELYQNPSHEEPMTGVKSRKCTSCCKKEKSPLYEIRKSKEVELLTHPLVVNVVERQWNSFFVFIFLGNLLVYLGFLSCFTAFVVLFPKEKEINCSSVPYLLSTNNITQSGTAMSGLKIPVLFFSSLELLVELIQVVQLVRSATFWWQIINLENILEIILYVSAILTAVDIGSCQTDYGVRSTWQYELAAVTIFLAWINFILMLRFFPFLGTYIVMLIDILKSLAQFSVVLFLFILSFALGFRTTFSNGASFSSVPQSLIKTYVMMTGEFDFSGIFGTVDYPGSSYFLFVLFIIFMNILVMNLMIGIAVYDIKEMLEKAKPKKYDMLIQFNLGFENIRHFFEEALHCCHNDEEESQTRPYENKLLDVRKTKNLIMKIIPLVSFEGYSELEEFAKIKKMKAELMTKTEKRNNQQIRKVDEKQNETIRRIEKNHDFLVRRLEKVEESIQELHQQ